MKAIPVLLSCIILLVGCGPTSVNKLKQTDGAVVMTPEEVLQLVDNNTLFAHSFAEDSYLYYDHSGKLFGKDIYNNKDVGQWDVSEDGELCMRMKNWWYGDLICFQVLASGNTYHLANSNGVLQYSAEQYTGDAQKLYYVVKNKKKSYRRSVRNQNQALATSSETATDTTSSVAQVETTDEMSKSVVEETSTYSASSETDFRSTVKWMARDCPGCNLAESDLKKADLVGANLMGANLRGATLKMSNLRRANLEGANLAAANLSYANLPGANLKNANLSGANLKGANLIRADLTGADLDGADLTEALLEGVKGLK